MSHHRVGAMLSELPGRRAHPNRDELGRALRLTCPVLITGGHRDRRRETARLMHRWGIFTTLSLAGAGDSDFASLLARVPAGSLFLDNLARLDASQQLHLFEFLGAQADRSDSRPIRVISGSSGALFDRIRTGRFRADLFYRLNTLHIPVD